jgi:hypothetical protein
MTEFSLLKQKFFVSQIIKKFCYWKSLKTNARIFTVCNIKPLLSFNRTILFDKSLSIMITFLLLISSFSSFFALRRYVGKICLKIREEKINHPSSKIALPSYSFINLDNNFTVRLKFTKENPEIL